MIKVKLFNLLRLEFKIKEMDIDEIEISVLELLYQVSDKINDKRFLPKLIDEEGNLLYGTIILINGKNVIHLDKTATLVKDGDEVSLFPPGGGG